MQNKNPNFAFFGTSSFSVMVLDELKNNGYVPNLLITTEDKPKGRKMILTPPLVKIWAEKEGLPYLQLKTLKGQEIENLIKSSSKEDFDLFIVASYGKIIPQNILDIPKYRTLNVHPSLLPKLRGASPIQSAILKEEVTGVTIMRVDEKMDHGPIVTQEKINIDWPPYAEDLEKATAKVGGQILSKIIPLWMRGKLKEVEQDENSVTFCEKIKKTDGEINLDSPAEENLRKIRALHIWPGAYFFYDDGKSKTRVIIKKAHIENGALILDRVVPEGKKEMGYKDFLNGKVSSRNS